MGYVKFKASVLIVGLYILVSTCVMAQPTTTPKLELPKGYSIISTDEIILRAKSQSQSHNRIFDTHKTGPLGVGTMFESPLLRLPQFKRLIKRGYIRAEWETMSCDGKSASLYLTDIYSTKIPKKRIKRLKERLSAKFGADQNGKVKASWFTGEIRFLYSTLETIFGHVSPEERFVLYKNGVVEVDSLKKVRTHFLSDYTPLYRGSMQWCNVMEPGSLRMKTMDGIWHIDNNYGLDCFEQWLNDRFRPPIDTLGGMLWLLTTDGKGQSHLTDLTPGAIAIRQKQLSQEVVKLVEQLPRMSFGFLITEDRRLYSGRFIQASYSKNDGWRLTETTKPKL